MNAPKVQVNLAREPFRQDRHLLVASFVTAALLLGTLVMLVTLVVQQRAAVADSRAEIADLEQKLRRLNAEHARLDGILREPENEVVLERSAFLNVLLQRKGISWTKLFDDLQGVFPGQVRLVSVRPFVTADNRVQLDMVVGAQSPEPVIQLLRKLEGSPLFGATAVQGWNPPVQNEPLYRYRVSVNYAQKL